MKSILDKISVAVFLIVFCLPNAILGQESTSSENSDHLSLKVRFQSDSTLHVKATYTVARLESDEIYFLLNPGYQINSIDSRGLKKYELAMKTNRPFPFYKLTLEEVQKDNGSYEVYFDYNIDLKTMNHIKSNWLEFNVDQLWFPNHDDLDNEFTWNLTIENIYENYAVASYNYDEIIEYKTIMDPDPTVYLEQKKPTPEVYLMMAENMTLWKNIQKSTPNDVQFFVHQDTSEDLLTSMNEKLSNLIQFFNTRFGKSERIKKYLVILRNTDDINFLQSRGEILLGNADSDNYASLAHEVAHYWWSFADFINEPWMNESFANYSMLVALDTFDKEELEKQLQRSEQKSTNIGSVKDAGAFPNSNLNAYYHKGSLLLWELEQEIGRNALMKLLAKRVKNKVDTTQGFLELLEKQEGKKTRMSFESKLQE